MKTSEETRAATLARPSKAQYEWQDMELGMFFHWFPDCSGNIGEPWDLAYQKERAKTLRCDELDMAQWVQSAKDLGAKYIVFVAKHTSGICRWRSAYGGLSFTDSKYPEDDPRGDPLRTLSEECRKNGIRLGVYINGNSEYCEAIDGGVTKDPARQEEYTRLYRGWLTEVLSKYGEMAEVWFDGSMELEIGDILKKYAPNAIVFQSKYANIRWVGQEEGYASDPAWNSLSRLDGITGVATERHGTPDGDCYMPLECDARLRKEWGFRSDLDANPLHSLEELMDMYYNSVGHGANLLINHAPASCGRILDEDMARMKEFGDEIRRRFGHPIASASGEGETVELPLGKKTAIDHVITMEELSGGERIRGYAIEAWDGGAWVRLAAGIAVGHKKIDYFEPFETDRIRIRVLGHVGTPLIRSISAHFAGVTPKIEKPLAYGEVKLCEYETGMFGDGTRDVEIVCDIEPFTDAAGQYRVSFRDREGAYPLIVTDAWVTEHGVRKDACVERAEGCEFNVYVAGPGQKRLFCAILHDGDADAVRPIQYVGGFGVGCATRNDQVIFRDVDFGKNGADRMTVDFANGDADGSTVAVYIDEKAGAPAAVYTVPYTGSAKIEFARDFETAVDVPGGVHTIIMEYTNNISCCFTRIRFREKAGTVPSGSLPAFTGIDVTPETEFYDDPETLGKGGVRGSVYYYRMS